MPRRLDNSVLDINRWQGNEIKHPTCWVNNEVSRFHFSSLGPSSGDLKNHRMFKKLEDNSGNFGKIANILAHRVRKSNSSYFWKIWPKSQNYYKYLRDFHTFSFPIDAKILKNFFARRRQIRVFLLEIFQWKNYCWQILHMHCYVVYNIESRQLTFVIFSQNIGKTKLEIKNKRLLNRLQLSNEKKRIRIP